MKKKAYQAPLMRVKIVQQTEMICSSTGSFTVSSREVTEGSDKDWEAEDLNW